MHSLARCKFSSFRIGKNVEVLFLPGVSVAFAAIRAFHPRVRVIVAHQHLRAPGVASAKRNGIVSLCQYFMCCVNVLRTRSHGAVHSVPDIFAVDILMTTTEIPLRTAFAVTVAVILALGHASESLFVEDSLVLLGDVCRGRSRVGARLAGGLTGRLRRRLRRRLAGGLNARLQCRKGGGLTRGLCGGLRARLRSWLAARTHRGLCRRLRRGLTGRLAGRLCRGLASRTGGRLRGRL
jgi:hypothetical protein